MYFQSSQTFTVYVIEVVILISLEKLQCKKTYLIQCKQSLKNLIPFTQE